MNDIITLTIDPSAIRNQSHSEPKNQMMHLLFASYDDNSKITMNIITAQKEKTTSWFSFLSDSYLEFFLSLK